MSGNKIASKKWNEAHAIPNYRRRFLENIPWVRKFRDEIYLEGQASRGPLTASLPMVELNLP